MLSAASVSAERNIPLATLNHRFVRLSPGVSTSCNLTSYSNVTTCKSADMTRPCLAQSGGVLSALLHKKHNPCSANNMVNGS